MFSEVTCQFFLGGISQRFLLYNVHIEDVLTYTLLKEISSQLCNISVLKIVVSKKIVSMQSFQFSFDFVIILKDLGSVWIQLIFTETEN